MPTLKTDVLADELIDLYAEAEHRLQLSVLQAVASGQLGTVRYRRKRLAAVRHILAGLRKAALPQIDTLIHGAYGEGVGIADVDIVGHPADFGRGIHHQAITLLADNLRGQLDSVLVSIGRQVEDVFRREGLREAAVGLLQGSTRKAASMALVDNLRAKGLKVFTDIGGRNWKLEDYSRMVIRTTSREAVTAATGNRLSEAGIDLVEISLSDKACPRCIAAYRDKVFSRTGATPGYPVLVTPPPLHPNDRCIMHAARSNLDALERELGLVA